MENHNRKTKKAGLYATVIFLMVSCHNGAENSNAADTLQNTTDTAKSITLNNGTHCFAYINNTDTVLLSLTLNNNTAIGKLTYNLYEKDKSTGILKGRFYGDTLFATYSFFSEGKQSQRQVAFLQKGNIFQEGSASMREEGSSLVFINKADVAFNGNIILSQVNCDVFNKNKGFNK